MATGVLKVRVGGSWIPIGSPGSVPAHAITHMAGGADALLLDTLASPTDVATLNATTSAHGLLPKLSGVATQFLNGIGAWAAPTGNMTGPGTSIIDNLAAFTDATGKLLKDSGIPLVAVARLDTGPTFAGQVTGSSLAASSSGWGSIALTHTAATAGNKNLQMYYASGYLVLRAMSDDWGIQYGYATLDTAGNLGASGLVSSQGLVTIGMADGQWPGVKFFNTYFTFNNNATGQLGWFHQDGTFNLNAGNLRYGATTFSIQNSGGTPVLTVRSDGIVTIPYFLVVPVGTDRWAPA